MEYKQLKYSPVSVNGYSLVPIRMEDRELIRKWRNEQMYHLRQQEALTESQQETYFKEVVAKLFESEQPTQYLFSYVRGEDCMGYGGLVHINYEKSSAELSFIMNTALEAAAFRFHWTNYLQLIENIVDQAAAVKATRRIGPSPPIRNAKQLARQFHGRVTG